VTATELLATLLERGVTLQVAGDKLRYTPLDTVTPELRDELRHHKAELLVLLEPLPAAVIELLLRCEAGDFTAAVRGRLAAIFKDNPPDALERLTRLAGHLKLNGAGLADAERRAMARYEVN